MTVKGNKHKQQSQNSDELKLVYQMHLRFAVMTFGTFLVCQLMKTQKGEESNTSPIYAQSKN